MAPPVTRLDIAEKYKAKVAPPVTRPELTYKHRQERHDINRFQTGHCL